MPLVNAKDPAAKDGGAKQSKVPSAAELKAFAERAVIGNDHGHAGRQEDVGGTLFRHEAQDAFHVLGTAHAPLSMRRFMAEKGEPIRLSRAAGR